MADPQKTPEEERLTDSEASKSEVAEPREQNSVHSLDVQFGRGDFLFRISAKGWMAIGALILSGFGWLATYYLAS